MGPNGVLLLYCTPLANFRCSDEDMACTFEGMEALLLAAASPLLVSLLIAENILASNNRRSIFDGLQAHKRHGYLHIFTHVLIDYCGLVLTIS